MNESGKAVKVGIFIGIGLLLLVLLSMVFSKGLSILTPTYPLHLHAVTVGGLKDGAAVLMSGVTVGNVGETANPEGRKRGAIPLKNQGKVKNSLECPFCIE